MLTIAMLIIFRLVSIVVCLVVSGLSWVTTQSWLIDILEYKGNLQPHY